MNSSIRGDLTDYTSKGYLPANPRPKPEAAFRILGLGDSFAVCDYRQGQNYHNFLLAALKAAGYDIDLINAGMAGAGPGYYWQILEKYGDLWQPDLVLVGFFVGNDLEEMDFTHALVGAFIKEPRDPASRWLGYLRFNGFWLHQFCHRKLTAVLDQRQLKDEVKAAGVPQEGAFSRQAFLNIEKKRMWIFEKDKNARLEALWNEKANLLLKFKDWCAQRRVALVIALFPDQFQVDRELRQEIYQTYRLPADSVDLAYPQRLISDYCRRHLIHYIDLLGPFRQSGNSQELYRLRDTHWNEAGNRLAGELIFNYLVENRLLGSQKPGAGGLWPVAGLR